MKYGYETYAQHKLRELMPKLKAAHWIDIRLRINGKEEIVEADWLKSIPLPELETETNG